MVYITRGVYPPKPMMRIPPISDIPLFQHLAVLESGASISLEPMMH